jgi:acyl-CoA reductase-like NAD-dependent aldehyde dehydrogenase
VIPPDTRLAGGYYLSPCILTDVTDDMPIAREEVFGSVACLFPFSTEDEVVRRANDANFGLAGGVFTKYVTVCLTLDLNLWSGATFSKVPKIFLMSFLHIFLSQTVRNS